VILRRQAFCASFLALLAACAMVVSPVRAQDSASGRALQGPLAIYAHDPMTGAVPAASSLSEGRALDDLNQLIRLKKSGLRVDCDLIDASAIAPDGLHSNGHTAAWPNGPEAWIAQSRAAGIYPGLHFAANALSPDGRVSASFDDRFSTEFIAALQSWYDRGIRLFAIEDRYALMGAATGTTINGAADRSPLRAALTAFRAKNRDAVLLDIQSGPFDALASPGAFTLLSTGPAQPSGTPQPSFERAIEIETASRVRREEQTGTALAHILAPGFVAARASAGGASPATLVPEWKSQFLLSMALGGWVHMLSGNLESVQNADARWMARVEKLFFALDAQEEIHSFGGPPMSGQPYGFAGATSRGTVLVVVNPGEAVATVSLPAAANGQTPGAGRILFRDAGFSPRISGDSLTLGPGQMAAVGFGAYAAPEFNLGVEQDVVIPSSIEPVDADFELTTPDVLEARIDPPIQGVLRVVVREQAPAGNPQVASDGSNHHFTLEITQGGRAIPLRSEGPGIDGEANLNAGLPWAVAEIDVTDLTPGIPLRVRFHCEEKSPGILEGSAYQVTY
jgi:hypothetical protein